jgi:hypothetical protein
VVKNVVLNGEGNATCRRIKELFPEFSRSNAFKLRAKTGTGRDSACPLISKAGQQTAGQKRKKGIGG